MQDMGSWLPRRWTKIGASILFAITLLAVARGFLRPFLDAGAAGASVKQLASSGSKDSSLQAHAWVDADRVATGRAFRVWLEVTNPASQDVELEKIQLHAPGFKPPVVHGGQLKDFRIRRAGSRPVFLSEARFWVPAGRTFTMWTDVTPAARQGSFFITVQIHWKNPRQTGRETLELGPIRPVSPALQVAAGVVDSLFSLLGTLAIPLTVALLGWYFQQRQQLLVQERQAWNAMLPVSHANNIKFYVPLLSGIKTFERQLEAFQATRSAESCEEAAFYLLFSLRRMREIDKGGSGFYLKNRQGEEILAACWSLFLGELRRELPLADIRFFLDTMRPMETFAGFQRKTGKHEDLKRRAEAIQNSLRDWAEAPSDRERGLRLILLFGLVLRLELNLIYRFWYGDEPELPIDQLNRLMAELRTGFPDLGNRVDAYLERLGRGPLMEQGGAGLKVSRSVLP